MRSRRRGRRLAAVWLGLVGIAGAVAVTSVGVLGAPPTVIDDGARAAEPPQRGPQRQVRPMPPPPACERVIVIGDSLTVGSRSALRAGLADAGFDAVVDGYTSRRIPATVQPPYSGVRAALSVRSWWGEADCWVIALGSNDLNAGAGNPVVAEALIEEMLTAVSPGADVWWVNVNYRNDSRNPIDEVAATAAFNGVLDERAAGDPAFEVIDWYTYSAAHAWWFLDAVHVNGAGYLARADQIVDALPSAG